MAPRFLDRLTHKRRTSRVYPVTNTTNTDDEVSEERAYSAPTIPIVTSFSKLTEHDHEESLPSQSLPIQRKRKLISSLNGAIKRVMTGLKRLATRDVDLPIVRGEIVFEPTVEMLTSPEQEIHYQGLRLENFFENMMAHFELLSDQEAEIVQIPIELIQEISGYQSVLRKHITSFTYNDEKDNLDGKDNLDEKCNIDEEDSIDEEDNVDDNQRLACHDSIGDKDKTFESTPLEQPNPFIGTECIESEVSTNRALDESRRSFDNINFGIFMDSLKDGNSESTLVDSLVGEECSSSSSLPSSPSSPWSTNLDSTVANIQTQLVTTEPRNVPIISSSESLALNNLFGSHHESIESMSETSTTLQEPPISLEKIKSSAGSITSFNSRRTRGEYVSRLVALFEGTTLALNDDINCKSSESSHY